MKGCLKTAILLSFWFSNLFGQTKSIFYNEKRRLIADRNYKISKAQLKQFIPVEKYLRKFISDYIEYPEQAKDNNDSGYVIVSFKINTTDTLQQVRIEKAKEKKNYLSNEVKRVFKKIRIPKSVYTKHLRNKRYFLAISFELLGKNYKHPGFIEIKQYYPPPRGHGIE
jgi:TonB family protein